MTIEGKIGNNYNSRIPNSFRGDKCIHKKNEGGSNEFIVLLAAANQQIFGCDYLSEGQLSASQAWTESSIK